MSTIPKWAVDLVAALEEHEEVHPAGDSHWCVKDALDAVPAEVRSYVAAWKDGYNARKNERATGGIIKPSDKWYAVGESGCSLPRMDTVRFGELEIRVVEHPSCPQDVVIALGSCSCGHPVGAHTGSGCTETEFGESCPCMTPASRLVSSAKVAPEKAES